MVRRRTWRSATAIIGLSSVATQAHTQSLSIEEQPEAPAPMTATPASPPPKAPVIVMPEPVSTPVDYPERGEGEVAVVLELTLSPQGTVTRAVAIEGPEPFASSATAAAKSWTFRPASRDGEPIAAKIRFQVRFVPPRDVEMAPPPSSEPAPASGGAAEPTYEIIVVGERGPIRHELSRTEVSRMPGAFGDAFRAIEALPGVVPILSGLPYFYVRGAPPGNVGYFFDGIPVPFLYHYAAGPSVFHPAFVDRVDLYPGAYPVRFGRFAGAIVAGEMAPPGYRLRGEWSVRLIDSGAMVEAPFAGGKGSLMLGGRYSYTGLVLSLIVPEATVGYWDYQARARYDIDEDDSVEVLAFGSSDYVSAVEEQDYSRPDGTFASRKVERTLVDVGFHRLDLRWDHRVEQGNVRTALMLGRDRTGVGDGVVDVYDYMVGGRTEYWKQLDPKLRVRAGADALFESLRQDIDDDEVGGGDIDEAPPPSAVGGTPMTPPAIEMPPEDFEDRTSDADGFGFDRKRNDFAIGVYGDLVWGVAPRLQVTPGLRLELFVSGKQAALGVDPRITAEYQIDQKLKLVHGLALVHQAPSFVVAVPGFKPSLDGGLQSAVQYSAGATYELPAGFSSSLALFQSTFNNMTDLISIVQLEQTADEEGNGMNDFRTQGHAYGLELMVRRSLSRKLGGFLSYTLSRSRRFARRISGPATTDRTHVLNVAASYDLGRDWRAGGRFLFYTGVPAEVAYLEAARRPPRTPPFWRIDFKIEKRWYIRRPNRWWGMSLEVLNTTLNKERLEGRCNAFDCVYEELGPITVPSLSFEGAL